MAREILTVLIILRLSRYFHIPDKILLTWVPEHVAERHVAVVARVSACVATEPVVPLVGRQGEVFLVLVLVPPQLQVHGEPLLPLRGHGTLHIARIFWSHLEIPELGRCGARTVSV